MTGSNLKRWRELEEVELETKRYRGELKKPDPSVGAAMAPEQRRTTEEALAYLKAVTESFKDEKEKYSEFLQVLRDFQGQKIGTATVVTRVKRLFQSHPALLVGFNAFLPRGFQITCPDNWPSVVELSSSSEESDKKLVQQKRLAQEEVPEQDSQQKLGPVGLEQALSFVNKVKLRFQKQQNAYESFLAILNLYKQGVPIDEVISKISTLFGEHVDLVEEFQCFLPPSSRSRNASSHALRPSTHSHSGRDGKAERSTQVQKMHERTVVEKATSPMDVDRRAETSGEVALLRPPSPRPRNLVPAALGPTVPQALPWWCLPSQRSTLNQQVHEEDYGERTGPARPQNLSPPVRQSCLQTDPGCDQDRLLQMAEEQNGEGGECSVDGVQKMHDKKKDDERGECPLDVVPLPLPPPSKPEVPSPGALSQTLQTHAGRDDEVSTHVQQMPIENGDRAGSACEVLLRIPPSATPQKNLSPPAHRSFVQPNLGCDDGPDMPSQVEQMHEKTDGGKTDWSVGVLSLSTRSQDFSPVAVNPTLHADIDPDDIASSLAEVQQVHAKNDERGGDCADAVCLPTLPQNLSTVGMSPSEESNGALDDRPNRLNRVYHMYQKKAGKRATRVEGPGDLLVEHSSHKLPKRRKKSGKVDEEERDEVDNSGSEESFQVKGDEDFIVPRKISSENRLSSRLTHEVIRKQCQSEEVALAVQVPSSPQEGRKRKRLEQLEDENRVSVFEGRHKKGTKESDMCEKEDECIHQNGSLASAPEKGVQNDLIQSQKPPQRRSSARIADELIRKQSQAAEVGLAVQAPLPPLLSEEDQNRVRLQQLQEEEKSLRLQKRQARLFDQVKKTLKSHHTSEMLLKSLRNLSRNIMLCPELEPLVTEVMEEQEIEYSQCKQCTPSFYYLPKSYLKPLTTFRTELDREVLNDGWVCVRCEGDSKQYDESGSSSKCIIQDGASKGLLHDKRLIHDEKLALCEDDQYEFHVLRGTAASTIERITEMVRVTESPDFQIQSFDWDEYLTPVNYRLIERMYGDYGPDLIEESQKNPVVALPVILQRLKQKQEDEWPEYEAQMNKIWAEVHLEHYNPSLDYSLSNGKDEESKPLCIDSFPAISHQGADDNKVTGDEDRREHLTDDLSFDHPGLENAYQIIKYLLEEVSMSREQFRNLKRIWYTDVDSIFSGSPSNQRESHAQEGGATTATS